MKHAILAFLFPLFVLVFGAPAQAQDCSLEAVATLTTELWGSEIAYTISDDNGILLSGENFTDYSTSTSAFCLDDVSGCLVLEMTDSFGDGWNGAVLYITVPTLGLSLGTFTLEEGNAQAITCHSQMAKREIRRKHRNCKHQITFFMKFSSVTAMSTVRFCDIMKSSATALH